MIGSADYMLYGVLIYSAGSSFKGILSQVLCFLCRTDGDRSYTPGVDLYIRCYWKCNGKF